VTDPSRPEIRSSSQIRSYYDSRIPDLNQDYWRFRWDASPIKREHYRQTRDRIERALGGRRFDRVAEVGCGPLVWTPNIKARARFVAAIDLSLAMLTNVDPTRRGAGERCCGDAGRLPLGDGAVDAVCSFRAFEYFPDKPAVLREFARVTKSGGWLALITKNSDYAGYGRVEDTTRPESQQMLHSGNVRSTDVVGMLAAAGFDQIEVHPAIVGRTRFVPVWRLSGFVIRFLRPHWRSGLPSWISTATESYLLTARRP
jgi:ubiquinone/menaquinone biosynthesis C-methylase UbiE